MAYRALSFTDIQDGLWRIELYLMQRYGIDTARQDMYPLVWYVNTDRASAAWIRVLLSCKPYMIARILHRGGSIDDVIRNVEACMEKCFPDWHNPEVYMAIPHPSDANRKEVC